MNDEAWRELAAQNPMRVTYPSWRPRSYWDARDKRDAWKPGEILDWRKANARKARILRRWAADRSRSHSLW